MDNVEMKEINIVSTKDGSSEPSLFFFPEGQTGGDRDYAYAPDWQAVVLPGDKCWTAEARIPYTAFGLEGRGGKPWRVNFHRRIRHNLVKSGSWSADAGDWHSAERFGKLEFD